jgi:hypothetical protein
MAMKLLENPVDQLRAVGTENSELHEELAVCYRQMDIMRRALTEIAEAPYPTAAIAFKALRCGHG